VLLRVVTECNPRQPEPETTQRAVKPFRARNGKTAISRTPVLPEAILLGPLSAQRRCAYFSTNDVPLGRWDVDAEVSDAVEEYFARPVAWDNGEAILEPDKRLQSRCRQALVAST
jgi:hypothetical protein